MKIDKNCNDKEILLLIRQLRNILFSQEEDYHETKKINYLVRNLTVTFVFDCAECEYDTIDDEDENKNDLCIINDKATEGDIEGESVSGKKWLDSTRADRKKRNPASLQDYNYYT